MSIKYNPLKFQIILGSSLLLLASNAIAGPWFGAYMTPKERAHSHVPLDRPYWGDRYTRVGPQKKQPTPPEERIEAAINAEYFFWQIFQNGLFEVIPDLSNALTAAYLLDPNDATTSALLGAVHTWRLSERMRMPEIPATITDESVLARKYFAETVKMTNDPHFIGFLGTMIMSEADIHGDDILFKKGLKVLKKGIRLHPEFNMVTAGLAISGGIVENIPSADSALFKQGLEWQWEAMELCFGTKFDRSNPDVTPYMDRLTITEGPKKVCWNTAEAPHKFEGFFWNMGDMLVKTGDWETAQKIYANARLSPDYLNWQYAGLLEDSITDAEANVDLFNTPPGANGKFVKPMMAQSAYACTGCHQH